MKRFLLLSSVLFSLSSLCFGTSLLSLDQQQVTQIFEDKTMTTVPLVTLNHQLINNTLTVFFDRRGKLTGQFTNKPEHGPQSDAGTWLVKSSGVLCAIWEHWSDSKPICVYVYKLNNGFLFVNKDNDNFESLVLKENIKTGNKLD